MSRGAITTAHLFSLDKRHLLVYCFGMSKLLHPRPDQIIAPELSTKLLSYNGASKSFSVDASQLKGLRMFGQLYYDAADVGVVLNNPTGSKVPFYLKHTDEVEGEVAGWRFEVLPESVAHSPRLAGLKLLIVNS